MTGGAGYIGAHLVAALTRDGGRVVVLDDLSTGDAARVDGIAPLVRGSVHDIDLLVRTLRAHQVTAVIHTAARKDVPASLADPAGFYRTNVGGLQALLTAMSGGSGVAPAVLLLSRRLRRRNRPPTSRGRAADTGQPLWLEQTAR
ncbi:NAD-dependent epimerase/dehydratase family protein [Jatrophihabitans lederbergiae]|uniref:NAD-dependent epimerase/dehydratase family protein n=1 Tax=Jatrophihabitans lederbergiae TaxID=3075547 RepID=UPI00288AEA8A|nr:NAD-dependent epimerase/dehydratase family protein [Jatrophihabitans sp. DSM 44399]